MLKTLSHPWLTSTSKIYTILDVAVALTTSVLMINSEPHQHLAYFDGPNLPFTSLLLHMFVAVPSG